MTSNIGAQYLQGDLSTPQKFAEASALVTQALHQHFRPEFLNRVDDVVIFNPLGAAQLAQIVELRLEELRRLLADRKISLELTDAAKRLLIGVGYDYNFGARPLRRAIQRMVQDPLSLKILDGEVLHGDHVVVDAAPDGSSMAFRVERHSPVASRA
jgi:ATP-dependent Clp protease ATP-binding subunit ClpB